MRNRICMCSARMAAGAVFAALCWGWFAPAPAQGSCGDYVTVHAEYPTGERPMPGSSTPTDSTQGQTTIPRPPANPAPHPCPGPGCSAPTVPESATSPAPSPNPDETCLHVAGIHLIPAVTIHESAPTPSGVAAFSLSDIFRPPRLPVV